MSTPAKPKFTNRLAKETSPYLKQHAHNPVDWYPWGPEALKRAKKEDKPIFLSIGYSACHWCHVMERESFEDEATAKMLNDNFVSIKVDREERQDIDHIYMTAVQVMTQHGGWPMSVFLTPDLQPFYGGTYFPPEDRRGMPAFKRILSGILNAWKTRRQELQTTAGQLVTAIEEMNRSAIAPATGALSLNLISGAVEQYGQVLDARFGGFGTAPKFFHTMNFRVLLRHWKSTGDAVSLERVVFSLEKISRGGIYDHLGGGFHRYSTDQQWLVPHFEKMLYDNALLAGLYLEAFQASGNANFARVASEVLDYVVREMTSPEGPFFSTQDADTEGQEGKFYIWTREEITSLLERDLSQPFNTTYNVTPGGNWEGGNILHRTESFEETAKHLGFDTQWLDDTLGLAKRKLYAARSKRTAPSRDDKAVVSWNGFMIEAMVQGYLVLGNDGYLETAEKAADFILTKMRGEKGKGLLHTYKDGQASLNGYLDDYAAMALASAALYEATGAGKWLAAAKELSQEIVAQFWDTKDNAFFFTPSQHEKLITRPRESQDGATPSASALAVTALVKVGHLTGDESMLKIAEKGLGSHERFMQLLPMAAGQMLVALEMLMNDPIEIVVCPGAEKDDTDALLSVVWSRFLPNKVVAIKTADTVASPLFQGREAKDGKPSVYVCRGNTCEAPVHTPEALAKLLEKSK